MRLIKKKLGIWYSIALCLLTLLCIPAAAELRSAEDFEFNAAGLTADKFVDRTVIAASRDNDEFWSIYFAANGQVVVEPIKPAAASISNKAQIKAPLKALNGLWSIPAEDIVCLTASREPKAQPLCFYAGQNGRGTDWKAVSKAASGEYLPVDAKEHRGEYQIVYSFAGVHSAKLDKRIIPVRAKLAGLESWRGHIVVGRTLKDKEAWVAIYHADNSLSFVYGSGRRFEGNYEIKDTVICMDFPDTPEANGCRGPKEVDGKIVWAAHKTGAFISQVLFLLPIGKESGKAAVSAKVAAEANNKKANDGTKATEKDPKKAPVAKPAAKAKRDFKLPKGECYAVIGSRKQIASVRKFIKKNLHPNPDVFVTQKGSYAISAFNDFADKKVTQKLIAELVTAGLLPKGTTCNRGSKFVFKVENWEKATDKQVKSAVAALK